MLLLVFESFLCFCEINLNFARLRSGELKTKRYYYLIPLEKKLPSSPEENHGKILDRQVNKTVTKKKLK